MGSPVMDNHEPSIDCINEGATTTEIYHKKVRYTLESGSNRGL